MFDALTLICSSVAGLRLVRRPRPVTEKLPNPAIETSSPFFRVLCTVPVSASTTPPASVLVSRVCWATALTSRRCNHGLLAFGWRGRSRRRGLWHGRRASEKARSRTQTLGRPATSRTRVNAQRRGRRLPVSTMRSSERHSNETSRSSPTRQPESDCRSPPIADASILATEIVALDESGKSAGPLSRSRRSFLLLVQSAMTC